MSDPTSKASYLSSGLGFTIGAVTLSQWVAVISIVLAVGTFLFNIWYKKKLLDFTRKHNEEMEDISRGKRGEAKARRNNQDR